jgi:hypothetical protein
MYQYIRDFRFVKYTACTFSAQILAGQGASVSESFIDTIRVSKLSRPPTLNRQVQTRKMARMTSGRFKLSIAVGPDLIIPSQSFTSLISWPLPTLRKLLRSANIRALTTPIAPPGWPEMSAFDQ